MSYDAQLIAEGLCPELVPCMTEDGPGTDRCRYPIVEGGYACEGHTQEIEGWRAMSEAERCEWERRNDR